MRFGFAMFGGVSVGIPIAILAELDFPYIRLRRPSIVQVRGLFCQEKTSEKILDLLLLPARKLDGTHFFGRLFFVPKTLQKVAAAELPFLQFVVRIGRGLILNKVGRSSVKKV